MEADFWHERWQSNQLGFHETDVNPVLLAHWPALGLSAAARVLVPLCGKSVDMRWLQDQGFDVVGVELSGIAIESFFAEQGIEAQCDQQGDFERFHAERLTLWQGDFFVFDRQLLGRADAIYDRAALIALPPAMREDYAAHLVGLIDSGTPCLLITLEYDQREMQGPPFAVDEQEVERLFAGSCVIDQLTAAIRIDVPAGLARRGLERLYERVYRLTRR